MPEFKFWLELEYFDEEKQDWVSCTGSASTKLDFFIEPVSLGVVEGDEDFAIRLAESFDVRNSNLLKCRAHRLRKEDDES